MPTRSATQQLIVDHFDAMPAQLRKAARYILDNPREVALISMRDLANKAGVQPATMTRLAKFLGLVGYNDIRDDHAETLRHDEGGFAARAMASAARTDAEGDELERVAQKMIDDITRSVQRLSDPGTLSSLVAAARTLCAARRIYVLGLRSCHSLAWHFSYVMSLLGDRAVLLDGIANTAGDGLMWAEPGDVLLVASMDPYMAQTVALATRAQARNLTVISLTDSPVSPLVPFSTHVVFCPGENSSFFHSLSPALSVSEVLCALIARESRSRSLAALTAADEHLMHLETYEAMPNRRL